MMVISAIPMNAYAADGDVIVFDGAMFDYEFDGEIYTTWSHDVKVNGVPKTIYCLQELNSWPESTTEYYSSDSNPLLDQEQTEVMRRLMYAGYPHNSKGYLDECYEDGDEGGDFLASESTQEAAWFLMSLWGKSGSKPLSPAYNPGDNIENYLDNYYFEFPGAGDIVRYALFGETLEPPATENVAISVNNDKNVDEVVLTKDANGHYTSQALKVEEPAGYNITYTVSVPNGLSVVDEQGNPITTVKENQEFFLTAEAVPASATVAVTADISYPTAVEHYLTDEESFNPEHGDTKPFQTMLCVGVATMELGGSLVVKAEDDPEPETGSLVIKKTLADDDATKAAAKNPDGSDMAFTFNINLADQANKTFSVTNEDGEVIGSLETNANCVGTISITGGQQAVIEGIPYGVGYTVSEVVPEDANGTWSPDESSVEGILAADAMNSVEIVNTYVSEPETGSLVIEKAFADEISKDAAGDTAFTFNVNLADQASKKFDVTIETLNAAGEVTDTTETELTTNENCIGTVAITGGQRAVINGIPCGVKYSVSEYVSDNANGTWKPIGEVSDETIATGENSVIITNSYTYKAVTSEPLVASKQLTGAGNPGVKADAYSFELVPEKKDNPMPTGATQNAQGWPVLTKTNDARGEIDFGTITFNMPGEYKYTVTESDVNEPNTSRDSTEYLVTYNVAPTDAGALAVSKKVEGGTSEAIVFTNTYNQASTTQDFFVKKRIEDTTGANGEHSLAGYKFKISLPEGAKPELYPTFEGTSSPEFTMTSNANGIANSANLVFDEAWFNRYSDNAEKIELAYNIKELPSGLDGIKDDTVTRKAKVTVTRSVVEGKVQITSGVKYSTDGSTWSSDAPEFVNSYSADINVDPKGNGDLTINVNKEFDGSAYTPGDEEYTFNVTPVAPTTGDSGVIKLKWTPAGWTQDGDSLVFTKVGTYDYQIAEVDPEIDGMSCDPLKWNVRFNVEPSETPGKLKATAVYQQEGSTTTNTTGATFTNTYETSADAEFEINKSLIGREWKTGEEFHFEVATAYDSENSDIDPTADGVAPGEVTVDKNITVGSEGSKVVSATMKEVGTYYFVVREVEGDDTSISYDNNAYVVKVVVANDSSDPNKLVASEPEYFVLPDGDWDEKDSADAIEFTNSVTRVEIKKTVSGLVDMIDPETTYTIKVKVGNESPLLEVIQNDESKLVDFAGGEHEFELKADEAVTIIGIPAGTEYTVEEILSGDMAEAFEPSIHISDETGVALQTTKGPEASREIQAGEQHKVYVDNATSLTNLIITKKVVDKTGKIDVDNELFDFRITAKHGPFNFLIDKDFEGEFDAESSVYDDTTVEFTRGEAIVTVGHGESLEIKGLPVGTSYEIEEIDPGKYKTETKISKKAATSAPEIAPFAVATPIDDVDQGTKAKGKLEAGKIDTVTFTNTMEKKNGGKKGGVDTGDHAPLLPMIIICMTSLIALIGAFLARKKFVR